MQNDIVRCRHQRFFSTGILASPLTLLLASILTQRSLTQCHKINFLCNEAIRILVAIMRLPLLYSSHFLFTLACMEFLEDHQLGAGVHLFYLA